MDPRLKALVVHIRVDGSAPLEPPRALLCVDSRQLCVITDSFLEPTARTAFLFQLKTATWRRAFSFSSLLTRQLADQTMPTPRQLPKLAGPLPGS